MTSNVQVRVTADVVDLQAKFALAKAETSALSGEFTKLARASVGGGLDPAAQARFQQLAGDVSVARSKLADLSQQMKEAHQSSAGFGGSLEELHSRLTAAFQVTGLAAAAEGIRMIGDEIEKLGGRAIEIRTLGEVLGVSTSQVQALEVAAEEAGVGTDVLAHAGERLTVKLDEARSGSAKAIQELLALGITTGDIANKSFQLNDVFSVLKTRLTDVTTAEQTRKALLEDLGARTALAVVAIKEYDGSQQGVADAMKRVNGLSAEQVGGLAKMKSAWDELGTTIENSASKALAFAGNALEAYKKAVLTQHPEMGASGDGGSVSGKIDRSGVDPQAQASARQQEALHSEVLQHEMEAIKAGVAAFGEGTKERLDALRQYASIAKQLYGSGNVDEVRKANSDVLAAEREFHATESREAIADAREQVSALAANTKLSLSQRLDAEREIWTAVMASDKVANAERIEAAREYSREYTEIAKETAAEAAAIARSDVSTDISISRLTLEAKKSSLDSEVIATKEALAQKYAALKTLADQEFALDLQALNNELAILPQETAAYEETYNKIRELKAKLVADLAALDHQQTEATTQLTKQQSTAWQSAVGEIESAEGTLVSDLVNKRKSLSQSLISIGSELVQKEIANDIRAFTTKELLQNQSKALEQGGLLYHLFSQASASDATTKSQAAQTAAQTAGAQARVASQASAAAEGKAAETAASSGTILQDAAKAAAGTYAALAGIPIVGPVLAPIAAAVAYGAVAAFESFDVGTNYVPANMMALIHEGEAVVPKKYNPAAGGKMPGASEDDGGGGDTHVHLHMAMNGIDGPSIERLVHSHAFRDHLAASATRYFNRGGRGER